MKKLLSAGFSRLKKDIVFWACVAAILLYAVVTMLNGCRQAQTTQMQEYGYGLDHYYYSYCLPIGLFCSVFTCIYLSTEYRDGTVRNKIIAGHTRTEIYLSGLIVSFAATLFMLLASLAGGLAGIPFIGSWQSVPRLAVYLLISVLNAAAFAAISTFIGILFSYKAVSQTLTILAFLGLLVWAGTICAALQEPEMTSNIILSMGEGMQLGEPTPNPKYVSGALRDVYEFLMDFLPTGQCLQMYELNIARPLRVMLSSLGITAGMTAAGIFIFRKKNLN